MSAGLTTRCGAILDQNQILHSYPLVGAYLAGSLACWLVALAALIPSRIALSRLRGASRRHLTRNACHSGGGCGGVAPGLGRGIHREQTSVSLGAFCEESASIET